MNIEKADYVTVVKFGSIEELNLKLYNPNYSWSHSKDYSPSPSR